MREWRMEEKLDGLRLDQAMGEILPCLGLRGRRRLIANSDVLLNGRPAKASSRVKSGDLLQLPESGEENVDAPGAFLIDWQEPYCFFYKPQGLHTARIASSDKPSLEAALPRLAGERGANINIRLLQRLDFGTSGIVAAALSQEAAGDYRRWEKEGRIGKYYLAFLEGRLEEPVFVDRALNTANCRKSRILEDRRGRGTFFKPLHVWEKGEDFPLADFPAPEGDFTLAGCKLSAGQRHQIRSHAAWLGHPLVGDELYGKGEGGFVLQHFALDFPGHFMQLNGPSCIKANLPSSVQKSICDWLADERRVPSCGSLPG